MLKLSLILSAFFLIGLLADCPTSYPYSPKSGVSAGAIWSFGVTIGNQPNQAIVLSTSEQQAMISMLVSLTLPIPKPSSTLSSFQVGAMPKSKFSKMVALVLVMGALISKCPSQMLPILGQLSSVKALNLSQFCSTEILSSAMLTAAMLVKLEMPNTSHSLNTAPMLLCTRIAPLTHIHQETE